MVGCGDTSAPPAATVIDPVDQEIMESAAKAAPPKEVPPGYTVNSGGEVVPISGSESSDQSTDQP